MRCLLLCVYFSIRGNGVSLLLLWRSFVTTFVYVCLSNLRTSANFSLRTSTFRRNTEYSGIRSPAGPIGRGLGATRTLWSAWQALNGIFPAGVDRTKSLISAREALFCTYASVNVLCFLPEAPRKLCAHCSGIIYHIPGTRYTTDNMHRSHRSNAAAHTPCVCDTPMCAVLLWMIVSVVVFHRPLVFFHTYVPSLVYPCTFFGLLSHRAQAIAQTTIATVHRGRFYLQLRTLSQPRCPAAPVAGTPCACR